MNQDQKEALRLISKFARCNIWWMSGNANKDIRQLIYSKLVGRKVSKVESGVTNIRMAIINLLNIDTNQCDAMIDRSIEESIMKVVSE